MKAIIYPAAPSETLKPLTDGVPEYLLPLANKPIVEHLIELLVSHGIRDIILILNKHMPSETKAYFGKGERWGADLSYSQIKEYKGVHEYLANVQSIRNEPFLCIAGNSITNLDLTKFMEMHEKGEGLLTIMQEKINQQANSLDSGLTRMSRNEEINIPGLMPFIVNPEALELVKADKVASGLNEWTSHLLTKKKLAYVYKTESKIFHVNSIKDYWEANQAILKREFPGILPVGKEVGKGIWVGRQAKLHPNTIINGPVFVGDRCVVKQGVLLDKNTIIGNNTLIDENTVIGNSVILDNTYVGVNIEIKESIVRGNCLIHIPRGVTTYVSEDFSLGETGGRLGKEKHLMKYLRVLGLMGVLSPLIIGKFIFNVFLFSWNSLTAKVNTFVRLIKKNLITSVEKHDATT